MPTYCSIKACKKTDKLLRAGAMGTLTMSHCPNKIIFHFKGNICCGEIAFSDGNLNFDIFQPVLLQKAIDNKQPVMLAGSLVS